MTTPPFTVEAREFLSELRNGADFKAYANCIWDMRYPGPEPKSTGAWPFVRIENQNVTQLRSVQKSKSKS